jgi:hypothetical protein
MNDDNSLSDDYIEDDAYENMIDNYYSHLGNELMDDNPYYEAPYGDDF